jgi:hypothetical protein
MSGSSGIDHVLNRFGIASESLGLTLKRFPFGMAFAGAERTRALFKAILSA